MRLHQLRIRNFRSFQDSTLTFGPYTRLVGENGAGKSAVLTALNVLFRSASRPGIPSGSLSEEDFHNRDTTQPIEIAATFDDLSDQAKETLKAYVRHDRLVVRAVATWSAEARSAQVIQYGARLVMKRFAEWFAQKEASASAATLRDLFTALREEFPDLRAATTKAEMEEGLRMYEEMHPELCELQDSEDQFYGWTKGVNKLRQHIQWVYVPAVKDASEEQAEGRASAIGELLDRSIRQNVDFDAPLRELRDRTSKEYAAILEDRQGYLRGISDAIERRLREWAHPGVHLTLKWNSDAAKSIVVNEPFAKVAIGEHGFLGELCRLGHGLQRSFIVAILQELASSASGEGPTLFLGIEEPELYQHPPQARHLAATLERLAATNAQVIVTTHSPYFVSPNDIEAVRLLRRGALHNETQSSQVSATALVMRLASALGSEPRPVPAFLASLEQVLQPAQAELFFTKYPVLVEGAEDVAYLAAYMKLAGKWDDFRAKGGHIIACGGKTNLSRPLAIALELGVSPFVVFDADGDAQSPDGKRDNACILQLLDISNTPAYPDEPLIKGRVAVWPRNLAATVREEFGSAVWDEAQGHVKSEYGLDGTSKKAPTLITLTLEELWNQGHRSASLQRLVDVLAAQ